MTMAEKINDHLKQGGVVQITTYLKSVLYRSKHAGMFFMHGENLHVKNGKSDWCLSHGERVLVGIKFGREVKK